MKGLFTYGFTLEEVREIQSAAKKLLMEGKTIMSWSSGGTSVSKQLTMPVAEVLEECAYALAKLEPTPDDMGGIPVCSAVPYRLPL